MWDAAASWTIPTSTLAWWLNVSAAAAGVGLATHGMTPSPITGASGNQEFLLHLKEHQRC